MWWSEFRKRAGMHRSTDRNPRKRTSSIRRVEHRKVRYLDVLHDNCHLNVEALIERGKRSAAFGTVDWTSVTWDVTESEQPSMRGHKQRNANLHYTQHLRTEITGSRIGKPFSNKNGFADVVKAIIRLRREIGGQGVNNQNELLIGFRYIYDTLRGVQHDLTRLTRERLDTAAREIVARETELSAAKRIEKLEEIARLLDDNGICRVSLRWHCSFRKPANQVGKGRLDDSEVELANQAKLPADGLIAAIAHLYHLIPKSERADRIRICFVALLVITGFRIGELLTLPANPVATEDGTGRRSLQYYPEKGAPPQLKWLMTASGEIADAIIEELLALTADAREMAAWLDEHPGMVKLQGLELDARGISVRAFAEYMNFNRPEAMQFLRARRIDAQGRGLEAIVQVERLIAELRSESYAHPVNVVKNSGAKLMLRDALACVFKSQFHRTRPTLEYAVVPVSEQQIYDFIAGKEGKESCFERYNVQASDGKPFQASSHQFRHWLNDLLDKGGLSDLEQAVHFGRRNVKDNRAYQHMMPRQRVEKARADLMNGHLRGPVADIVKRAPVDRQQIILEARVQAVHVVPGGACFHPFSQSPCPHQMACKSGCGDFHWVDDDPVQDQELEYERQVLETALDTAKRELEEGTYGADSWVQHQSEKLEKVNSILADVRAQRERSPGAGST